MLKERVIDGGILAVLILKTFNTIHFYAHVPKLFLFVFLYLCLHCRHGRWGKQIVRETGQSWRLTKGWLFFASPWRKTAESSNLPRESLCGAPHQPPGTGTAERYCKSLSGEVITGNDADLQFLPRGSEVQCTFCPAAEKNQRKCNNKLIMTCSFLIAI